MEAAYIYLMGGFHLYLHFHIEYAKQMPII